MNLEEFERDWLRVRRAAFDKETARLRVEGFELFLATIATSWAFGSVVKLFLFLSVRHA